MPPDYNNQSSLFDVAKNSLAQFFDSFQSQDYWSGALINVKRIALIVSVIFGALLTILIIKLRRLIAEQIQLLEATPPKPDDGGPFISRWEEVKRHIESGKEAQWKLAVIEADALVDDILKKASFAGETMGERLTLITHDQLQSVEDLWYAHKLRNQIAHEADFTVTQSDAIEAIHRFEKALKELGVLQ